MAGEADIETGLKNMNGTRINHSAIPWPAVFMTDAPIISKYCVAVHHHIL